MGAVEHLAHRRLADAACGEVDDTKQGLVVGRVDHQTEIGQRVLYLPALVERHAAIDAVGDTQLAELVFYHARLGIGAVQHRVVVVGLSCLAGDGAGDEFPLVAVVLVGGDVQQLALLFFGIDLLGNLPFVAAYKAVGSAYDVLRRAVVALQLEEAGSCKLLAEAEDVVDVGTTEGVDALGIVAYHADVVVGLGQCRHDARLAVVGVLILVNKDVAEDVLIFLSQVGAAVEQAVHVDEQVVEIHGVGLLQALVVGVEDVGRAVDAAEPVFLHEGVVLGIVLRGKQVVFRHRDAGGYGGSFIDLVVQLHLFDDLLDEALGVGGVVDGVVVGISDAAGLLSQYLREDAVEGAHPQVAGILFAHQFADTLFHLARRLVGEGQGQDVAWRYALLQQPRYLVGQHARLARPCAGYHQRGALGLHHSLLLRRVEVLQDSAHR